MEGGVLRRVLAEDGVAVVGVQVEVGLRPAGALLRLPLTPLGAGLEPWPSVRRCCVTTEPLTWHEGDTGAPAPQVDQQLLGVREAVERLPAAD